MSDRVIISFALFAKRFFTAIFKTIVFIVFRLCLLCVHLYIFDDKTVQNLNAVVCHIDNLCVVGLKNKGGFYFFVDFFHQFENLISRFRIEVRRRLVRKHNVRLGNEGARNRNTLALPA